MGFQSAQTGKGDRHMQEQGRLNMEVSVSVTSMCQQLDECQMMSAECWKV